MRVAVAGGSGFLGRALVGTLRTAGHEVLVLTRGAATAPGDIVWTPNGESGPWAAQLAGVDAIVNLAGAGLADRRWTPSRKALLVQSRIQATSSLVAAALGSARPPRVFLSGSGVGVYGPRGDEPVTEASPAGSDFVATMATAWEQAAAPVASASRLALLRTAMVLGPGGGALKRMLLPFKLGVGGRLGSGRQWMSWIHLDDWVALVQHALADATVTGPINLSSPGPVRNAAFTKGLGRVLRRPTVIPVPAIALEAALGELSAMLLTGQRALPAAAEASGFRFRYPDLDAALAASV